MSLGRRTNLLTVILAALGALLVAMFAGGLVAKADAQAACDQYPDLPQCSDDPVAGDDGDGSDDDGSSGGDGDESADDGGGAGGPSAGSGGGTTAGPTGSIGKGELPFTGYPLTPLLLVLLILLLLGLTIRAYLALRERLATAGDGPPLAP